jgi:DNA-binding transcriptional LysR family regulator
MSWDDLRYLLSISRRGTLTGAAGELGVTHTTVGRRLAALERQLGVRLFHRTPEGLVPTPAGQEMLEAAQQMEAEALGVQRRIMGQDAELRGALRVSIFDFLLWKCGGALESFVTRYPGVDLTLTATLDPVSLTRREADVAIRLTDSPPETLIGRRVCEVGFAVYASEALVARIGPEAPYGAYPWIGWDERLPVTGWFDRWLAEHAPGARVAMRVDENALLRRHVVRAGLGAFFLPCFEGDALPDLRRLGPVHFTRQIWLLTLPELRHTRRVRSFIEHMALELRDEPAVTG